MALDTNFKNEIYIQYSDYLSAHYNEIPNIQGKMTSFRYFLMNSISVVLNSFHYNNKYVTYVFMNDRLETYKIKMEVDFNKRVNNTIKNEIETIN